MRTPRPPAAPAPALAALVALVALVGLAPPAHATRLIDETYRNATPAEPTAYNAVGGSIGWSACLTASTTTTQTPIPGCPAGQPSIPAGGDPAGAGALRITDNQTGRLGYVIFNRALPLTGGVDVRFKMYFYNGSGADGLSFFIADGTVNVNRAGSNGGPLGYSQSSVQPGVPGGLLGVGFDSFGNYASTNDGQGAGCAQGNQFFPNHVGVRGPGVAPNWTTGYCKVAFAPAGTLSVNGATSRTAAGVERDVRIVIDPPAQAGAQVTVSIGGTQVLQAAQPAGITAETFEFGFAGATGAATNIHEIRDLTIDSIGDLPRLKVAKTASAPGTFRAGATGGQFTIQPSNEATSPTSPVGAETKPVQVVDTLPAGMTVASTPTGTGWDCSATTVGSATADCTIQPPAGGFPAGTDLPALTIPVATAATATGTFTNSATASSIDNANAPTDSTGTAAVTLAPDPAVAPASVPFADTRVGTQSATETITVTNDGDGALTVAPGSAQVRLEGANPGQFVLAAGSCAQDTNLAAGGSCAVTARFAPTSTGAKSATLVIPTSAGDQQVPLTGTGTQSNLSIEPTARDFEDVRIGASSSREFTVRNTGTASLNISSVAVTSGTADYTALDDTCAGAVIAPTGTCTFSVRFSPSQVGARPGQVRLVHDGPSSPTDVALTGTGVEPRLTVTPASADFGDVLVGTATTRSFTVRNTGTAPLAVGTATIATGAADYSIPAADDTCSGTTVAVNATCTLAVRFDPDGEGTQAGELRLPSDAPDSPATVALTGRGVLPRLVVDPNPWTFGQVQVGQSASRTFTVTNAGTAPLAITGTGILTGGAAFAIPPGADQCSGRTLPVNATCTAGVRFAPTATGARTGVLRFTQTSPAGTTDVQLSGTGTPAPPRYGGPATLGTLPREIILRAQVPVPLVCADQPEDERCGGQVDVAFVPDRDAAGTAAPAPIGSAGFDMAPGTRRLARVPLDPADVRALARAGQGTLRIVVRSRVGAGTTTRVTDRGSMHALLWGARVIPSVARDLPVDRDDTTGTAVVECRGPRAMRCVGTLSITLAASRLGADGAKGRRVTVGRGTFAVAARRRARVRVKFGADARAVLERRRLTPAGATLDFAQPANRRKPEWRLFGRVTLISAGGGVVPFTGSAGGR